MHSHDEVVPLSAWETSADRRLAHIRTDIDLATERNRSVRDPPLILSCNRPALRQSSAGAHVWRRPTHQRSNPPPPRPGPRRRRLLHSAEHSKRTLRGCAATRVASCGRTTPPKISCRMSFGASGDGGTRSTRAPTSVPTSLPRLAPVHWTISRAPPPMSDGASNTQRQASQRFHLTMSTVSRRSRSAARSNW